MKIVTDLSKFEFGKNTRGKNPVIAALRELEVGKHLLVEASDWKQKTKPSSLIGSTFRNEKKFRTLRLKDGKGWIVTRIN